MQLTSLSVAIAAAGMIQDAGTSLQAKQQEPSAKAAQVSFHPPVRLRAGSEFIGTESPGYATPAWFDVTGDGMHDLVVGQFTKGKMHVFAGLGDGKFASGTWLKAEGEIAEVPGVW